MALVPCPDCGREVSDAAPACPQCGRPMVSTHVPEAPVVVKPTIWQDRNMGALGCGALILLIAFGLYFTVCNGPHP